MNKYLARIIIPLLLFLFSGTIFSQQCEDSTDKYGKKRYVYYGTQRITRAEGSESRMAVAFRPNSGGIRIGDKIVFSTAGLPAAGDWYVIYQKAEDFPADVEKYFLPLDPGELPADSAPRNVKIVPPTKYYYKDNLIASLGGTDGRTVKSTVKKLSPSMELDTTGWEPGLYWFTLQNTAVSDGKNSCSKTTPPVMVQLVTPTPPPDVNKKPIVDVSIEGDGCKPRTIKAVATDEDNLPDSKKPPQTLRLTWDIRDKNDEKITPQLTSTGNPTDATYIESATMDNLLPGKYTISVEVWDGKDTNRDSDSFNRDADELIVECRGAGLIYFQFDEPNRRNPNIIDPDNWLKNYGRRGQCTSFSRPDMEFPLFYEETSFTKPVGVSTNKEKLDEIARILLNDPELKIYIAGYADFRANPQYNIDLVGRRLAVVKKYLISKGIHPGRFDQPEKENYADFKAQTCAWKSCDENRRWDRRVELIYFKNAKPKLPYYPDSKCPVNANLLFGPDYEGGLEILGDE